MEHKQKFYIYNTDQISIYTTAATRSRDDDDDDHEQIEANANYIVYIYIYILIYMNIMSTTQRAEPICMFFGNQTYFKASFQGSRVYIGDDYSMIYILN